jgi:hypothetical protein
VHALETGLGLVTVAICLDFCEKSDDPVGLVWARLAPALILVPSMGEDSTNDAHLLKAKDLFDKQGGRVLVASQHDREPRGLGLGFCGDASSRFCPLVGSPILVLTVR